MKYLYRAVNTEGMVVTGSVDAESRRTAVRKLVRQGLNVVDINSVTGSEKNVRRVNKVPSASDLLIMMNQLCTLLESGVSLEESVESLAESEGNQMVSEELGKILSAFRRGEPFSRALTECNLRIPGYFQALAESGELTGKLAQAVHDGVGQWEYELKTANEMRNALTYPMILVVSGVCAVMLIFIIVVPKFVKLLNKAGGDIPLLAQIVLNTGQFVNEHLTVIILIAAVLTVMVIYVFINEDMRGRFYNFLAKMPLLKQWMRETAIGHWSSMLSTLLENRVQLLQALDLACRYVTITSLHARLVHVSESVRDGSGFAEALKEMEAVTAIGYSLIKVGERSGQLPKMLRSIASLYMESSRNRVKRILILFEPIAILVIGGVIGSIMGGIILAITSVNNITF